ncbi:MAG: hypothetical protein KC897_11310, partial [Candidatus Omnitrophica bacterium]|nr:hypothetical protein [Candidatus Omnitrophota bacterium]
NKFDYDGTAAEYFSDFMEQNYFSGVKDVQGQWERYDADGHLLNLVTRAIEEPGYVDTLAASRTDRAVLTDQTEFAANERQKALMLAAGQTTDITTLKNAAQAITGDRTTTTTVPEMQSALQTGVIDAPKSSVAAIQPIQPRAPNTVIPTTTPQLKVTSETTPSVEFDSQPIAVPALDVPVITPTPAITDKAIIAPAILPPVTPLILGSDTNRRGPVDTAMLALPSDTTKILVEDNRITNLSNDVVEFDGIVIMPKGSVEFDYISGFYNGDQLVKLPIRRTESGQEQISGLVSKGNIRFEPNEPVQFNAAGQIQRIGNVTFRGDAQDLSQARSEITQPYLKNLGSMWIAARTYDVANPEQPDVKAVDLEITDTPAAVLRATGWTNRTPIISNKFTASEIQTATAKLNLPETDLQQIKAITTAEMTEMEGATYTVVDTDLGRTLVLNKDAVPQLLSTSPAIVEKLITPKTASELRLDLSARKTITVNADEFNAVMASPQAVERYEAIKDDMIRYIVANTDKIDIRDSERLNAAGFGYVSDALDQVEDYYANTLNDESIKALPQSQRRKVKSRSVSREVKALQKFTENADVTALNEAEGIKIITNDEMQINDLVTRFLAERNYNEIEIAQFQNLFDMRTLGGHADANNVYLTPMAARNMPYQVAVQRPVSTEIQAVAETLKHELIAKAKEDQSDEQNVKLQLDRNVALGLTKPTTASIVDQAAKNAQLTAQIERQPVKYSVVDIAPVQPQRPQTGTQTSTATNLTQPKTSPVSSTSRPTGTSTPSAQDFDRDLFGNTISQTEPVKPVIPEAPAFAVLNRDKFAPGTIQPSLFGITPEILQTTTDGQDKGVKTKRLPSLRVRGIKQMDLTDEQTRVLQEVVKLTAEDMRQIARDSGIADAGQAQRLVNGLENIKTLVTEVRGAVGMNRVQQIAPDLVGMITAGSNTEFVSSLNSRITAVESKLETVQRRNRTQLNKYFDIFAGQEGSERIMDFLKRDPQAYVGFADMTKVSAADKTYVSYVVDALIPATVRIMDNTLKKYGGTAIRQAGDEIEFVLPSKWKPEEVEMIRQEVQNTVAGFIPGRFGFGQVQLEGVTDENRERVIAIAQENLGDTVLNGVYQDDDGLFMVFDRQAGVADLQRDFDNQVIRLNAALAEEGVAGQVVRKSDAMKIYSPEVVTGIDMGLSREFVRNEAGEIDFHKLYGQTV